MGYTQVSVCIFFTLFKFGVWLVFFEAQSSAVNSFKTDCIFLLFNIKHIVVACCALLRCKMSEKKRSGKWKVICNDPRCTGKNLQRRDFLRGSLVCKTCRSIDRKNKKRKVTIQ